MSLSYRNKIYSTYTEYSKPAFLNYDESLYDYASKPIMHNLKPWLPLRKNICCLDVACGTGIVLYGLHKAGYDKVSGIDISPQQIEVAKNVCNDVSVIDALIFLRKNTCTFDLITAYDILEHYTKDEIFEVIEALFNSLKPGGRLVVQTPNAESPWGMSVRYGDITHELAFTPKSLGNVLSICGFVDFQAKGCGPFIHGFKSMVRWSLWRIVNSILILWNVVETGSKGSGIYTRVFVAKADRPLS